MIEILDESYNLLKGNGIIQKSVRFSIRIIANLTIPLYFKVFSNGKKYLKNKLSRYGGRSVVVSLTSFPARIENVWLVIECVLRQDTPVDNIILYLSKEQFPNEIEDLPKSLTQYYKKDILSIKFVSKDLRSHKKYFYAFQEFRDSLVILLDDDLIYTKNIVGDLIKLNKQYPKAICCHRGHLVHKGTDNKLLNYKEWSVLTRRIGPTGQVFHTSGGGTLYDPKLFYDSVFDVNTFTKVCFYADDVWLNVQAYLSGLKIVKSSYYTNYIPIQTKHDFKLSAVNVGEGLNDIQIKDTLKYYGIKEEDIFNN